MSRPRFNETDEEFDARKGCPTRVIVYGGLGVLLFFCGLVLFPVWQAARPLPIQTVALSNLKQVGFAIQMYAVGENDHLPLAANWVDATTQYSRSEAIFHSPEISPDTPTANDPYGLAFRSSLTGEGTEGIKDQNQVALVFDSNDLTRNASGELDLLPNPPRHKWQDRRVNYIGFVDGHVLRIPNPGVIVK